jgi:HlyD family secretion protein
MKRRTMWIAAAGLAAMAAGVWLYWRARGAESVEYRFARLARGSIEASVSSTGTLEPVTTVQVGTQVSGQIAAIYVDFNDRVRKGQVIARIDPTLQEQAVREAEASLQRSEAQLAKAEADYDRDHQLHETGMISHDELRTTATTLAVARADAASARVALDRAKRNLEYTTIYAPINGVVVERNVDVGQTVAASLQAPQLFLIANDLSRMQILATVDESDIGMIHEKQPVRFTVQAWPDTSFAGVVRQVRLQSTVKENVVNYAVVVDVDNRNGKLRPGMTATLAFITGSARGVLTVPNAALRFRPPGTVRAAAARTDSLWSLGLNGRLAGIPVRTGLTDGQRTEVSGERLTEGMQVVIGTTRGDAAATATTATPFQQQGQQGPPPPGM